MSSTLPSEENIPPPSSLWADITHFTDQSASVNRVDFGDLDWLPVNVTGNNQPIEQRPPRVSKSMSLANGISAEFKASLPPSPAGEHHTSHVITGKKTRGIGRPRLRLKDDETAAERRRAQVRLAQQAYRQRKEVALSSLRSDCDDLKDCLDSLGKLFDQLFDLAVNSNLSTVDEVVVRDLKESSKKFRRDTTCPAQSIEKTHNCESNSTTAAPSEFLAPRALQERDTTRFSELFQVSKSSGTSYPDLLSETLNLNPFIWQPSNNQIDPFANTELPFSLRLRYEGLKRGYSLITAPDVPYSSIFRTFKFCIFSNSRDQIQREIEHQLHESTKNTYEMLYNAPFESMQSDKWWESILVPGKSATHPLLTASAAFLPSWPSLEVRLEETNLAVATPDELQEYVDSEGVEQYLVQKGLSITLGSSYVPLQASTGNTLNTKAWRSMFDEMSAEKNIMLDVGKLLHELLAHTVCLKSGPSFRKTDIDEAIRATILAAI